MLRTWGIGESALGELVAPRLAALDALGEGAPTIAFLARGLEGVQLRVTVKAASSDAARATLDREERALRELIGDNVFGVDDETIAVRIGGLLTAPSAGRSQSPSPTRVGSSRRASSRHRVRAGGFGAPP